MVQFSGRRPTAYDAPLPWPDAFVAVEGSVARELTRLDDERRRRGRGARVLVIQSDAEVAELVRTSLELDGYTVLVVSNGREALARGRAFAPECVILDLALSGLEGYRVLREMRQRGNDVPVLVLTSRSEEAEKVVALRLGADDYVTTPFGCMELLARVEALLRRARRRADEDASDASGAATGRRSVEGFGDVVIDPAARTVTRAGVPVAFAPKAFELLLALVRRRGAVATRAELLREVWGYEAPDMLTRTVDVHVLALRRKLEEDPTHPRYILTVRKVGYRIAL